MYNIGQSRKGLLYKATILRKVFILEQFRVCNMVTTRKCLFPNGSKPRCILNPKEGYYFICPHFTVKQRSRRRSDSSSQITYLKMRARLGPSMPVILSHGLGKEGKFEKASHSMPQRGARSVFSTASPPTFLA